MIRIRNSSSLPLLGVVPVAALLLAVAGCSSEASNADPTAAPSCPNGTNVSVSASVDQWGNIAAQLAGDCGTVDTVIRSSSVDPHDYEPTTADIQQLTNAQVAVINGADYDDWAKKALGNSSATVVDVATVCGAEEGANPHLWYDPECVKKAATAMTEAFKKAGPADADYFNSQQEQWQKSLEPYNQAIADTRKVAEGKTYGATESVFDYMAAAVGLKDVTPQGYQNAARNESDPSPGDIQAFQKALKDKQMNVLILNIQTEGPIPSQLDQAAQSAGVPVVPVTETLPADETTFQQWQIDQLNELQKALS